MSFGTIKNNIIDTTNNASIGVDDTKVSRQNIVDKANAILNMLLSNVASTYVTSNSFSEYALNLKALAFEAARVIATSENVFNDLIFTTTRPEFFYQNIETFLFVNRSFPFVNKDDINIRNFLLSILKAWFNGSRKISMLESLRLAIDETGSYVTFDLYENYLESVKNPSIDWVPLEHTFRADIFTKNSQVNINEVQTNIKFLIDLIKPAHTNLTIRFIYTEDETGFTKGPPCKIVELAVPPSPPVALNAFNLTTKEQYWFNLGTSYDVSAGFHKLPPHEPGQICDVFHLDFFVYNYEDFRHDCSKNLNIPVQGEPAQIIAVDKIKTRYGPLGDGNGNLVSNVNQVKVYVNNIQVPIQGVDSLKGIITLVNPLVSPSVQDWKSATIYSTGDIVSYFGNFYISVANSNTNNQPVINDVNTAFWQLYPITVDYIFLRRHFEFLYSNNNNLLLNQFDKFDDDLPTFLYSTVLWTPKLQIDDLDSIQQECLYQYQGYDALNSSLINYSKTLVYNFHQFNSWNSAVTYSQGSLIAYGNDIYSSQVNSNLNNLPTNTSFWKMIGPGFVSRTTSRDKLNDAWNIVPNILFVGDTVVGSNIITNVPSVEGFYLNNIVASVNLNAQKNSIGYILNNKSIEFPDSVLNSINISNIYFYDGTVTANTANNVFNFIVDNIPVQVTFPASGSGTLTTLSTIVNLINSAISVNGASATAEVFGSRIIINATRNLFIQNGSANNILGFSVTTFPLYSTQDLAPGTKIQDIWFNTKNSLSISSVIFYDGSGVNSANNIFKFFVFDKQITVTFPASATGVSTTLSTIVNLINQALITEKVNAKAVKSNSNIQIYLTKNNVSTENQIVRLKTVADVSGSLNEKYFNINTPTKLYSFWFNVNNASISPPKGLPGQSVEIKISTNETAIGILNKIKSVVSLYPFDTYNTYSLKITDNSFNAGDKITINGIDFTYNIDWFAGLTISATATNIANAINSSLNPSISYKVIAIAEQNYIKLYSVFNSPLFEVSVTDNLNVNFTLESNLFVECQQPGYCVSPSAVNTGFSLSANLIIGDGNANSVLGFVNPVLTNSVVLNQPALLTKTADERTKNKLSFSTPTISQISDGNYLNHPSSLNCPTQPFIGRQVDTNYSENKNLDIFYFNDIKSTFNNLLVNIFGSATKNKLKKDGNQIYVDDIQKVYSQLEINATCSGTECDKLKPVCEGAFDILFDFKSISDTYKGICPENEVSISGYIILNSSGYGEILSPPSGYPLYYPLQNFPGIPETCSSFVTMEIKDFESDTVNPITDSFGEITNINWFLFDSCVISDNFLHLNVNTGYPPVPSYPLPGSIPGGVGVPADHTEDLNNINYPILPPENGYSCLKDEVHFDYVMGRQDDTFKNFYKFLMNNTSSLFNNTNDCSIVSVHPMNPLCGDGIPVSDWLSQVELVEAPKFFDGYGPEFPENPPQPFIDNSFSYLKVEPDLSISGFFNEIDNLMFDVKALDTIPGATDTASMAIAEFFEEEFSQSVVLFPYFIAHFAPMSDAWYRTNIMMGASGGVAAYSSGYGTTGWIGSIGTGTLSEIVPLPIETSYDILLI